MRIKICGVTTVDDAVLAARLGAVAPGLNFYPASKRHVTEAQALVILAALPASVEAIALYVNTPLAEVRAALQRLNLRTAQLHADRHEVIANLRWVPAFSVKDANDLDRIDAFLATCQTVGAMPTAVLVDAHVSGEYGGTGQRAPWQLLADYKPIVPLILAGGLTPDNVAEAIRIVRPYAVDVASGVESGPGRKDAEKMRRFIDAARLA